MNIVGGLSEVQEINVGYSQHEMTVSVAITEKLDTVAHNLGVTPFFDYMISLDGGNTFEGPTQSFIIQLSTWLQMYADKSNLYFHYLNALTPNTFTNTSLIFRYRLYLTEQT